MNNYQILKKSHLLSIKRLDLTNPPPNKYHLDEGRKVENVFIISDINITTEQSEVLTVFLNLTISESYII